MLPEPDEALNSSDSSATRVPEIGWIGQDSLSILTRDPPNCSRSLSSFQLMAVAKLHPVLDVLRISARGILL
jgi:hypothetical protein